MNFYACFLNQLRKKKVPAVFRNIFSEKIKGHVEAYDDLVVVVRCGQEQIFLLINQIVDITPDTPIHLMNREADVYSATANSTV